MINKEKKNKVQNLLSKRNELLNGSVHQENEEICKRNKQIILDHLSGISERSGNMKRVKMWKIKQRVCPKQKTKIGI